MCDLTRLLVSDPLFRIRNGFLLLLLLALLVLLPSTAMTQETECGIFVATTGSDHAACGLSPDDPCRTIDYGSQRAATLTEKCVFVQAGNYAGIVRLREGVTIIGGYDTDWEYDAYSASGHAVVMTGGFDAGTEESFSVYADAVATGATLSNVIVDAPDASGTYSNCGRGSYGIVLHNSTGIVLENLRVIGGNGSWGANGNNGTSASQAQAPSGGNGQDGISFSTMCDDVHSAGGSGGYNSSAPSSRGGAGGTGGSMDTDCSSFPYNLAATPGSSGANGGTALGGSGGYAGATCFNGAPGSGGSGQVVNGVGGAGGGAGGWLRSTWSFWYANTGSAGSTGLNGGGGGGGGGAGGCDTGTDDRGPGGGGGGAGGAAAPSAGGAAGGGGGSFGVYAVGSSATVTDCVIERGTGLSGGHGGDGGTGQPGGNGGSGGLAAPDTYAGAPGGAGGRGGHSGGGGGGAGGDSWGIYRVSSTITASNVTYLSGSAGAGGSGGGGYIGGSAGTNGVLGTIGPATAAGSFIVQHTDTDGNSRTCDPAPCLVNTGLASVGSLPSTRLLLGIAPNPVRERARLELSLPSPGRVLVTLYDVSGRLLETIADEEFAAGLHTVPWEGRLRSGRSLAPGVYWVRASGGDRTVMQRITIVH